MKRHRRRLINRNLIPESPEKRAERKEERRGDGKKRTDEKTRKDNMSTKKTILMVVRQKHRENGKEEKMNELDRRGNKRKRDKREKKIKRERM